MNTEFSLGKAHLPGRMMKVFGHSPFLAKARPESV
jgi:hypothetical protein